MRCDCIATQIRSAREDCGSEGENGTLLVRRQTDQHFELGMLTLHESYETRLHRALTERPANERRPFDRPSTGEARQHSQYHKPPSVGRRRAGVEVNVLMGRFDLVYS